MASNVSVQVIGGEDEEEGFDWEAAIKQIDEACEKAKYSASCNPRNSSTHFSTPAVSESLNNLCLNGEKKPAAVAKQSTLDRFIQKSGARVSNSNNYEERACIVDVEGDESVPYVGIDIEAAKSWIYPVNIPHRDYQFAITKTALFSNTLVALPTGLGKTLIAAVVMYNYFRWFPDGKIVFAAPSRPLVLQQIEACHNIVGIPQEWTIDMTGQLNPAKRAGFWKSKRVFFVTPQVLEKDIQSGTCLMKHLVCLVIDEAHRAMGNFSYCVAVRELMAVPVQLRILALTATPGSKQQTVQQIIDNLCISTIEYRNESDPDVSPYVHNREIELIQVPLGKDAQEINNQVLEVIRPYVAKLSANGVLQSRDYQTLSPIDLLNSRDKFRQAPPPDLPHIKYGEVEAYFGALITVYHIRKLLSSHGIRPAYEMLEEKLQHGTFARLMSKNEGIMKAKLLMQRSLSHGAPSPKLSKMLEVLVDHFKTHDAQNSRVIIFSNFRGSVRDIMDALGSIGDLVKATEFIGQSSGKALKGQSQKVQQAVLQKFRAGGYNVIVATSIGEEGLDIMEVDLVICFDANISPLRMIQRMGRTGRKHDGRVVVLACEGSEMKGYMRKQANSRAIKKHMRNGGVTSFNFHSSSRMVPHILKPEVQFVELSIEKFVPRVKNLKDEGTTQTPVFEEELSSAEATFIAKYFHPGKENVWRPSLIAFPDSQTYPSKVHEVMHSWRTGMLIDSMQSLQGITCLGYSNPRLQDEVLFTDCLPTGDEDHRQEVQILGSPVAQPQEEGTDSVAPRIEALIPRNEESLPDFIPKTPPSHSHLFSSEFVSVDALGNVIIISVPSLCSEQVTHLMHPWLNTRVLLNSPRTESACMQTEEYHGETMQTKGLASSKTNCRLDGTLPMSREFGTCLQKEKLFDIPDKMIQEQIILKEKESSCEILNREEINFPSPVAEDNNFEESELSPRLTSLIEIGVVPESPITTGLLKIDEMCDSSPLVLASTEKLKVNLLSRYSGPAESNLGTLGNGDCERIDSVCCINDSGSTVKKNCVSYTSVSPAIVKDPRTPLANLADNTSSKSWCFSSGEKVESVKPPRKFKRLRKLGDCMKPLSSKTITETSKFSEPHFARALSNAKLSQPKHLISRKKKFKEDVKTFIDEEAEVSTEGEISADEVNEDNDSYDDSFIDDRINPSAASTQAESGRVDMMAIYRRSLLSQSPAVVQCLASTPDLVDSVSRGNESRSPSVKSLSCLQTPQSRCIEQEGGRNPELLQKKQEIMYSEALQIPVKNIKIDSVERRPSISASGSMPAISDNKFAPEPDASMERRASFSRSGSIPAINLDKKFLQESESRIEDSSFTGQQVRQEKMLINDELDDDDLFYASIDLDAIEAQANLLLRQQSESVVQKQEGSAQGNMPELHSSPSFDLGIW